MFDLLLCEVEFNCEFPMIIKINYYKPLFTSQKTPNTSFLVIGLRFKVGYYGKLYNFLTIAKVWLGPSPENLTSINFFGLRDL